MKPIHLIVLAAVAGLCACESGSDAAIEVNQPPAIAAIGSKQSPANEAVSAIQITLTDEAPADVQLTARADNESLMPPSGITITGQGAQRTLLLQPAADRIGTTMVTLRAVDAKGRSAERQFELSIIRQQRSIQRFARAVFSQPGNGVPLSINAIEFVEDAEHDDFADLFD